MRTLKGAGNLFVKKKQQMMQNNHKVAKTSFANKTLEIKVIMGSWGS